MESRIRRSAILVAAGLIVALVTLLINHPLAFIVFISVAALLVAAGIVLFLIALVREPQSPPAIGP